jgi:hypothetical protein
LRSKAHIAPIAPLVLHRTRIGKCALKIFGKNFQLRNRLFIVIHRFSLVKAAMTAPHLCDVSYLCLSWRNGVNKTPFTIAKGGTKTIAHT